MYEHNPYYILLFYIWLQQYINCMDDLLLISDKWKYVINLPSTEFPIKSNKQILKFLKILNGSNAIGFSRSKTFISR